MKRTELVILLLILAIAAGMRLYGLGSIPAGITPDEAVNGTDAQAAAATGDYQLFYPNNGGREGLFINLQALSVRAFGNTPFALRLVSALAGILTVLAVYLLTRRMFDSWELAAMAAFLMATGFWHVGFSRVGFRAILGPLLAAWGFYELYKGIETHRLWHWGLAGLFFGLGFHAYLSFRVMLIAVILVLLAYWWSLWRIFRQDRYHFTRHQMLGGVASMIGVLVLVALPMIVLAPTYSASPMDSGASTSLWENAGLTLGMFFLSGDTDWQHAMPGAPLLFWPVAALFAVGLVRSIWHVIHSLRMRGHPGVVHVLLLAWFGIGILPGILPNTGIPNALLVLTAAPAVFIMAALGLHWFMVWLRKWYSSRDAHQVCLPWFGHAGHYGRRMCTGEGTLIVGIATVALLISFGIADAQRYFVDWGHSPQVADAFSAHYLPIATRLNILPPATLKYVIVSRGNTLIDGIPVSARPVMFLTNTGTAAQQAATHITYLTLEQFRQTIIPRGAVVIQLDP